MCVIQISIHASLAATMAINASKYFVSLDIHIFRLIARIFVEPLFRNKTSKLRVTGLWDGNSTMNSLQKRASNAENVFILWRDQYSILFWKIASFWLAASPTIYDEIGAAARNIHYYTVIGFWYWGGSGADSAYWNIACNRLPLHFHNTFGWI